MSKSFIKLTEIDEGGDVYCKYYYEIDINRSVTRSAFFNFYDGVVIWDDVASHGDDGSLLGNHSCIEGAFPDFEDYKGGQISLNEISEEEFERNFTLAKAVRNRPFDARIDVYPHR